jgi:hypothetical protein
VAETKQRGSPITVTTGDGLSVTAKLNWPGGSVVEATLTPEGSDAIPLEPSRAAARPSRSTSTCRRCPAGVRAILESASTGGRSSSRS